MSENAEKIKGKEILGYDLAPESEYRVKRYDFKRPDKFAMDQIRTIYMMHETFTRRALATLSAITHHQVELSVRLVDQCTYVEYIEKVGPGSALAVVAMNPLRGSIAIEFTEDIAAHLIHSVCGGNATDVEKGPLSELAELALSHGAERLLRHLAEAWSPVVDLKPQIGGIESDPQHAQIVPPTEMIVLVAVDVRIGENTGAINIAMPYIMIEPIVHLLSARYWFSMIRSRPRTECVSDAVAGLDLEMQVAYETAPIRLSNLRKVCAGELLLLKTTGQASLMLGEEEVATLAAKPNEVSQAEYRRFAVLSASRPEVLESPGPTDHLIPRLDDLTHKIDRLFGDVQALSETQRVLSQDLASESVPERDVSLARATTKHAETLAVFLSAERHQMISFVLSLLSPELAATLLSSLDPAVQPDVVKRLVQSGETDAIFRDRVSAYLSRVIAQQLSARALGGPVVVSQILNQTPRSVERHIMETFQQEAPELFESVARLMFVFEDFVLVDKNAIRKLLARVSTDEMAMAMKDVPDEVARHILGALEADVAGELEESIGRLGRVRRQDVDTAQREVIEELRQLEEAGEVIVARPEEMLE
jgi:flagellar motor switch protein FliM